MNILFTELRAKMAAQAAYLVYEIGSLQNELEVTKTFQKLLHENKGVPQLFEFLESIKNIELPTNVLVKFVEKLIYLKEFSTLAGKQQGREWHIKCAVNFEVTDEILIVEQWRNVDRATFTPNTYTHFKIWIYNATQRKIYTKTIHGHSA